MITERDMLMDALCSVKHDIQDLTKAAQECSDPKIRQSIVGFRDLAEQTQQQLAQVAMQKGWYVPPPAAEDQEIQTIKSQLMNSTNALKVKM